MVERRGLFWALKLLGLIWEGDLPWLNSLVVNKAKSKKTKKIPWLSNTSVLHQLLRHIPRAACTRFSSGYRSRRWSIGLWGRCWPGR